MEKFLAKYGILLASGEQIESVVGIDTWPYKRFQKDGLVLTDQNVYHVFKNPMDIGTWPYKEKGSTAIPRASATAGTFLLRKSVKYLLATIVFSMIGAVAVFGVYIVYLWEQQHLYSEWVTLAIAGGVIGLLFFLLWFRSGGIEVTINAPGVDVKARLPNRAKRDAIRLVGEL